MKIKRINTEEAKYLRRLYFDELQSLYMISKLTGRKTATIRDCIKKFGKPRTWSEAQLLANRLGRGQGIRNRGVASGVWKGGRGIDGQGYMNVCLSGDDPFYPMAHSNGRVLEHRLIMAQHLNRLLTHDEIIHHLNGIKTDNRLKNLVINSRNSHPTKTFIPLLQRRIKELEAELAQQNLWAIS